MTEAQQVKDLIRVCNIVTDTLVADVGVDAIPLIQECSDEDVSKVWWDVKFKYYPAGYLSKTDIRYLIDQVPVGHQQLVRLLLSKITVPFKRMD